jgi:stage II sporulation protein AA (anti-sigma F factor antagonist)
MDVHAKKDNGDLVLSFVGELDDHSAPFVRKKIDDLLEENSFDSVIFDMSRLTFMDSTGIGVLIGRYKKLKDRHKLYIRNPSKSADMIFQISGIYNIMPKI